MRTIRRVGWLRVLLVTVLAGVLVACGGSGADNGTGPDGSTGNGTDGGDVYDAGSNDAGMGADATGGTDGGGGTDAGGDAPVPPDPNAPVIVSFAATSGPPTGGGATTLAWQVTGATTLSIDQNVGVVTGTTSTNVNVLNDTVFTLTATNSSGTTTAKTAVAVPVPAYLQPIVTTSAGPTLDYGVPYDSIIGAPVLGATTPAIVADTPCMGATWCPVAAPGINSFDEFVKLVETDEDYLSTLEISASVDVNAGAFSGSDKFDYFKSHQLDSKSIYLWVQIRTVANAQQLPAVHIDPNAALLDPASFYRKYGDRYAYLAVTGSELYGLLTIKAQTVEDKVNITNTLEASVSGIKGGVTVDNTVKSTLDDVLKNTTVTAAISGIGIPPANVPSYDPSAANPITTFVDALETAEQKNTSTPSNIRYYYTHYLGLPGYPGLPPNVANLVTQYDAGQSEWLQYNSVTTKADDFGHYFTDPNLSSYVAANSILAAMKSHVGDMATWINAALGDSLSLTAAPQIAPADALSTFATIDETPSMNANGVTWNAHTLTNGFVPYTAADYDIAARYADDSGNLDGVKVVPRKYQHVTDLPNNGSELPFELYACKQLVNGALTPAVGFAWSNQVGEFFLVNADATSTGQQAFLDANANITNAASLATVIANGQTINTYEYYDSPAGNTTCTGGTCESGNRRFVIVNMATGDAMGSSLPNGWNSGSGQNVTQDPFTNQPGQWWGFVPYTGTPNTYLIVNDQVGLQTYQAGFTYQSRGYLLNLSGNGPYSPGNPVIAYQNYPANPDGNSIFTLSLNPDGYADIYLNGNPTIIVGVPPTSSSCQSNCFPDGTPALVVAKNGYLNEKWLYMPMERIYLP